MSGIDKEELAHRAQKRLDKYILGADRKSSILITAQFAFIGLVLNVVRPVWGDTDVCTKILIGFGIGAGIFGVTFAGLVIYPRETVPKKGYLFWEDILEHERREYIWKAQSVPSDEALKETVEQNYALSKIASKKYGFFRLSLVSTAIMVFFLMFSAFFHIFTG